MVTEEAGVWLDFEAGLEAEGRVEEVDEAAREDRGGGDDGILQAGRDQIGAAAQDEMIGLLPRDAGLPG